MHPIILTCALNGGGPVSHGETRVPVTPREIADQALAAAEEGTAVAHIHVRDPETGAASMKCELYEETVDLIRAKNDRIIISLTTGSGSFYVPGENGGVGQEVLDPDVRSSHIRRCKPELCTLNIGCYSYGNGAIVNTASHIGHIAKVAKEAGTVTELEVFDTGHLWQAQHLMDHGIIDRRAPIELVLGYTWGARGDLRSFLDLHARIPSGNHWSAVGVGAAQFPILATSLLYGGNCRVGLEDTFFLANGDLARSNVDLVKNARSIVESLGLRLATAEEARTVHDLRPRGRR